MQQVFRDGWSRPKRRQHSLANRNSSRSSEWTFRGFVRWWRWGWRRWDRFSGGGSGTTGWTADWGFVEWISTHTCWRSVRGNLWWRCEKMIWSECSEFCKRLLELGSLLSFLLSLYWYTILQHLKQVSDNLYIMMFSSSFPHAHADSSCVKPKASLRGSFQVWSLEYVCFICFSVEIHAWYTHLSMYIKPNK